MIAINKALFTDASLYETVFARIQAGISPKAIGRGEMVAVIIINPLTNADGTVNNSELFAGSASNMIYFMIPGQESPIFYAEDQKDIYVRLNFPAINPNGAILTFAVSGSARGTGYTVGDVLTLADQGNGAGQVTVATINSGITESLLGAGGAGYMAGDNVTVNGGTTLAHIIIDTVDGGGAVLTYHIASAGNGYAVANGVATTGGAGAGFTIDITEILGSVLTATLTTPGLGYAVEDISTPTGGTGAGVVIVVLTVETVLAETADIAVLIYRLRKGAKQ